MSKQVRHFGILAAAIVVAWAVCGAGSYVIAQGVGLLGATLAAVICLWAGIIVLMLQNWFGLGVKVVLGASLIRLFVVAGLAGLTFWLHGGLDGQTFLISLGITYLFALAAETWILHSEAPHRASGK